MHGRAPGDGRRRDAVRCRSPFIVLATQNPIEYEGTFPLPEAQLDRFLIKMRLGYLPAAAEEPDAAQPAGASIPSRRVEPVFDGARLPELIASWCGRCTSTRRCATTSSGWSRRRAPSPTCCWAPVPAGSLALYKTSQAWAALHGRDYVLPDDVKQLAPLTLAHRCLVHPESALRGRTGRPSSTNC